jgi:biopolymer transport protein ExbD
MDSSGGIRYQGELVERSVVEQEIGAAATAHPNLAVVLSVDPRTPWQELVSFVELVQKLEITSFSFNMKGDA